MGFCAKVPIVFLVTCLFLELLHRGQLVAETPLPLDLDMSPAHISQSRWELNALNRMGQCPVTKENWARSRQDLTGARQGSTWCSEFSLHLSEVVWESKFLDLSGEQVTYLAFINTPWILLLYNRRNGIKE